MILFVHRLNSQDFTSTAVKYCFFVNIDLLILKNDIFDYNRPLG